MARTSCIFSSVIFLLILMSVGVLVFVLKFQRSNEVDDATPRPQTTRPLLQSDSMTTESFDEHHEPWLDFRLPSYIVPSHYDLLLHPDLERDTFSGMVNITVDVTRETRYFVVHAYKLTVADCGVYDPRSGDDLKLKTQFAYAPNEYFVLEMQQRLRSGKYILRFEFSGNLTGSIVGFYKSTYSNRKNESRSLATSKFQPTYARRAFPCFDEPSFKTTFSVSLVHTPDYAALSNMPVEATKPRPSSSLVVTTFQKSVPMVTYLVCFIVCDFEYMQTTLTNGKQFRVYSAADHINKTKYALKFGSRVLEYYEDYFDMEYPLPKQDMIAIPDYVSGATEHWGIITFRETNLLYDENKSSPPHMQRIAAVVAHEMAHMWFGNLVTMGWWDDLWLNEGFASYVEYKGIRNQHPEWNILAQFVSDELQPVLSKDSTLSSHPIVQTVKHPDEITEIFDDISYKKGASIIRMLEFFMGEENFRNGISNFLKRYRYKNAKTSDLWRELSAVNDSPGGNHSISDIMKMWTERMGFPCVTVERQGNSFVASQKRFLKNEQLRADLTEETVWRIPLSYLTSSGENGIIWIHDLQKTKFTLNETEWVKFNVNQTGYYVVNYSRDEWQKLTDLMLSNHEVLSPSDRSNLLFDSFLLVESGLVDFDVFLSLCRYLKRESHLVPWETAYTAFVKLCHLLEFTDTNILLKSYIRDLTDDLYKDLGWESSENHLQDLLRTTVIGLACHSGNQHCLAHTAELFQNWTQGQNLSPNLRKIVFHYGMTEIGKEEHWNYMWSKYLAEESPAARRAYLYGLAYTKLPSLIHRYLEYAMDEKKIRRQDFFTVLNYIAGNSVGRTFVWNFLREKWPKLVERFTLNDRYLGFSVSTICSYFTTDMELEQMKSFFAEYPDAGAGRRRRLQALETVQNNIHWLKTYKKSIRTWLEMEGSSPWYYHRLPSYIVPEHYDLLLHPSLQESRFSGTVTISVRLQKPSDVLIVHSRDLNITRSAVTSTTGEKTIELDDVFQHEINDYLVLKTGDKLPVGMYKLYFEFEGLMSSSLQGLYRSSYFDPALRERRYLSTTQFEPTSARAAFPCFDEPHFKATFNVSVLHASSHFALSNAAVKNISRREDGLILTEFERSPPMVTYLICVVVCDFNYRETYTEHGVRMRAYSAPHLVDKTEFVLNISSRILVHFEKYFNTSFPLKKLDMIAIPDFNPNGMENWGLITYAEDIMIVDSEAPDSNKLASASIIAHELAHMWFGDLVTMQWWSDLWLNEGFATFVSWKGTQHAFPDLHQVPGVKRMCYAMENDQSIHSHPVVQRVTRVTSDIFDSIAYSKGSSVLRMLESYMGDDFRRGVTNYLQKYSFQNARTEDLWAELSAASKEGVDIGSMMDTWTKQMNYPYITVEGGGSDTITLQQKRFLRDPASHIYSTQHSPFNYNWKVPVSYITSKNSNVSFLLLDAKDKVNVSMEKSGWFKFNVNFTGYYSVNYEEEVWRKFIHLLENNHTVFSRRDRINLLFDAFNLAEAGIVDYSVPLNLSRYLKKEEYHEAWYFALGKLTAIRRYFMNDREMWHMIKEYVRNLSKDLYLKCGLDESGSFLVRELRRKMIRAACDSNNYDCLERAAILFRRWMKGEKLGSETSSSVYKYGMRYLNDEESFLFLWNRYLEETDPSEKSTLIYSLSTVRNVSTLERMLRYSRNESYFRKGWQVDMMNYIARNPKGHHLVASYIFNNWTDIVRSHGVPRAERLAFDVFSQYQTEKDLDRVRQFYRKHRPTKEMERMRSRTLEAIRTRVRWHLKYRDTVAAWFQNNVYMPWSRMRLPRHVKPIKYDITLKPNISKSSLEGEVAIEVEVTQETDYILVHQNGLKIIQTECPSATVAEAFPHKKTDFWVVRFKESVPPGIHVLRLKYRGSFALDGKGIGLYHYTHRTTGEKRALLATQFEATYARRAFPCFDEPNFKASFKISIVHEDNYTALSNMPEQNREVVGENLVKTTFEESVNMSTYLVCFVVSDFHFIEIDYKGKPVRAFAPPDRLQEAERSLNLTVKFLEILEEFFDVPYQLPKLDSVAIPSYTVPGMEHWGVITYNTKRFLEEGDLTSHQMIVEMDRVIAHELVHQWFGNLVTMKWWNDVWLNEGVATLIMYVPLGRYYPAITEVDVRKMSKMMCTDSDIDSNPILRNVTTPKEISEIFDAISYEKGGAVMKMLQHTLKEDFRKGLTSFLKKYAYKNADTNDLWNELMRASPTRNVNISDMMDTWTKQMGFPYVELKRRGSRLEAEQRWFLRKVPDSAAEDIAKKNKFAKYGMMWKIPLVYKNLNTGREETLWLNGRNATFDVEAEEEDVVKFNPDFVGFYVVKYDPEDWARLGRRLLENHEDFSTTDRYNLLHDAFLLAETDRLVYDVPLQLTKYLGREREAIPWTLLRDHFIYVTRMLDGTSTTLAMLKEYVRGLTYDLYEEYVWNTGNRSYFHIRKTSLGSCSYTYPDLEFVPTVVDLACRTGNERCLHAMHEELQIWMLKQNTSADLSFMFKVAVPHYGNETLWQFLYEQFIDNETSFEKKLLLTEGLVAFSEPSLILKTLDVIMWHPDLDVSLIRALFQGLGDNPVALPILWNYTKTHWDLILNRLEANNSPTVGISVFCDNFKTMNYFGEFIGFLKQIPIINDFVISGCIEEIQNAISWSDKYHEVLRNWLTWNTPDS